MTNYMLGLKCAKLLIMAAMLVLFLQPCYASAPLDVEIENPININFSTGDLKLEVSGLNKSFQSLGDSTKRLTIALEKLSENPNISDKEGKLIREAIIEISNTTSKITDTVNYLPEHIKRSQQPIEAISDALAADVKSIIVLTVMGFMAILAAAAFLAYRYFLKPVKIIAENMKSISASIENTVSAIPDLEASTPGNN